jgi:hypothetical protein
MEDNEMIKRKREKDKQFLQNTTKKQILSSKKHLS